MIKAEYAAMIQALDDLADRAELDSLSLTGEAAIAEQKVATELRFLSLANRARLNA
jgi:hypothetical protein